MTCGYIVSGRGDLDTIFKARASGAGPVSNYFSNGGVDLALRFEPRGSTTPVADTGFRSNGGVDFSQKFMAIGAIGSNSYTLVSGNLAGLTGYSDGLAFPDLTGDSISTDDLGAYKIAALVLSSGANHFVLKGAANAANTDSSWLDMTITGIFANSAGSSVTRTFTRAAASYSTSGPSAPNLRATWILSGTLASFINGNSYAVTIRRS